jgi:uncharacterized integral membrane protein
MIMVSDRNIFDIIVVVIIYVIIMNLFLCQNTSRCRPDLFFLTTEVLLVDIYFRQTYVRG